MGATISLQEEAFQSAIAGFNALRDDYEQERSELERSGFEICNGGWTGGGSSVVVAAIETCDGLLTKIELILDGEQESLTDALESLMEADGMLSAAVETWLGVAKEAME
jgi:hypothetical protein